MLATHSVFTWNIAIFVDTLFLQWSPLNSSESSPIHWVHPSHKRGQTCLPGEETLFYDDITCIPLQYQREVLLWFFTTSQTQVECAPLCQIGWYRNGTYIKNQTGIYSIQTQVKTNVYKSYCVLFTTDLPTTHIAVIISLRTQNHAQRIKLKIFARFYFNTV